MALAEVTDEFLAYLHALYAEGTERALDEASEFLVTAATLLELKTARLLPQHREPLEEDVALLEARDLLFARLLQYRAYREVADIFAERWAQEAQRFPRAVALEERFAPGASRAGLHRRCRRVRPHRRSSAEPNPQRSRTGTRRNR